MKGVFSIQNYVFQVSSFAVPNHSKFYLNCTVTYHNNQFYLEKTLDKLFLLGKDGLCYTSPEGRKFAKKISLNWKQ